MTTSHQKRRHVHLPFLVLLSVAWLPSLAFSVPPREPTGDVQAILDQAAELRELCGHSADGHSADGHSADGHSAGGQSAECWEKQRRLLVSTLEDRPDDRRASLQGNYFYWSWTQRSLLAKAYLELERFDDLRPLLIELEQDLEANKPAEDAEDEQAVYRHFAWVFWQLQAQLADREERQLDAVVYYRKAHSFNPQYEGDLARATELWRVLGGRPADGWPLEERMRHYDVPAVSIAVIYDFEVAWAKAYGVADRETGETATVETLFQAASISKPVTATAALRLVDQGKLALDTPINDTLTSWQVPDNEHTAQAPVTLRRLLSHTAGTTVHGFLPGYAVHADVPTVVQVLDGEAPAINAPVRVDIVPGSRYRYSGGGTTIVQRAMMDLAGQPFPALMRALVLGPAGMEHSTYEQPLPPERLSSAAAGHLGNGKLVPGKRRTHPEMAAAGLWTTPTDLARFAIAIQRSLRGDDGALLAQATAQDMLTPVLGKAGLGLFLDERGETTYFHHGGSNYGFRCLLTANREAGYGVVVMTNSDNGGRLAAEMTAAVARVDGWQGYENDEVEPIDLPSASEIAGQAARTNR